PASSTGTVTLTAPAPAGGAVVILSTVDFATGLAPGSSTVPGSVTIPAGATSATFTVLSSGFSAPSSTSIYATLGGPDRGIVLTAVLKVLPPSMTLSTVALNPTSVAGGNPSTGTVTLSAAAPA